MGALGHRDEHHLGYLDGLPARRRRQRPNPGPLPGALDKRGHRRGALPSHHGCPLRPAPRHGQQAPLQWAQLPRRRLLPRKLARPRFTIAFAATIVPISPTCAIAAPVASSCIATAITNDRIAAIANIDAAVRVAAAVDQAPAATAIAVATANVWFTTFSIAPFDLAAFDLATKYLATLAIATKCLAAACLAAREIAAHGLATKSIAAV